MKYGNIDEKQEFLLQAIEDGDLKEVMRLVQSGVDPNFETNDGYAHSPIYLAISKHHLGIAIWLLDHGHVKPTEKIHHWAAIVVGDIGIANAVQERL